MRSETILIVDDEKLIRWSLSNELSKIGFVIFEAESVQKALNVIHKEEPDLLLLDQNLPDGTGINILQTQQKNNSVIPSIMMTAVDRSDVAVQALKLGAVDYITKPINVEELKIIIEKSLEQTRLRRQIAHLLKEQEIHIGSHTLIGKSLAMQEVFKLLSKYSQSSTTTVLITGESGTGKEVAARALHYFSDRKDQPFMAVNCSALSETLIESELFGHEKGAFTDAKTQRKGVFELAHGGTIFLDEIGDISPSTQVKLLRVLEEKSFRRVGGSIDINVDVRIITATNRPLEQRVQEGTFRSDLFYRLNVVHIPMPPVRKRGEDILLLAEYFLQSFNKKFNKHFKGLSHECKKIFIDYHWPGNVREIRNVVERAVLLDDGDYIFSHDVTIGHLHQFPESKSKENSGEIAKASASLYEIEKQALLDALKRADNNQSEAARLLKISRDTLRYRLKKYGIGKV